MDNIGELVKEFVKDFKSKKDDSVNHVIKRQLMRALITERILYVTNELMTAQKELKKIDDEEALSIIK